MQIKFTKMHGLGNDFMVIESITQKIPELSAKQISQWSDRHFGVGFDQLLLIEPARTHTTDFYYRIFNADGSEVGQCGNGARCLARFVINKHLTSKNNIRVSTQSTEMELIIEPDNQVTVDLGIPQFNKTTLSQPIALNQQNYSLTTLSLGNPHAVLMVNNIENAPVEELGKMLNQHPQFPEGVNVGFLKAAAKDEIYLRVYERGTGETLACGSGAAAAVVAGNSLELLNDTVTVYLPGGKLRIYWNKNNNHVYLTGPAVFVFDGIITL